MVIHWLVYLEIVLEAAAVIYLGFFRLPRMIHHYRELRDRGSPRGPAVVSALVLGYRSALVFRLLTLELAIWYYLLFGWWAKPKSPPGSTSFTFHKSSSWFALYLALVHAIVAEGVIVHLWLRVHHPLWAWISTAVHIYSVLWLTGDWNAIRLSRITLSESQLLAKVGLRKEVQVPFEWIESWRHMRPTEPHPKDVFSITVMPSDNLCLDLQLSSPVTANGFFQQVDTQRVILAVDDCPEFIKEMEQRLAVL